MAVCRLVSPLRKRGGRKVDAQHLLDPQDNTKVEDRRHEEGGRSKIYPSALTPCTTVLGGNLMSEHNVTLHGSVDL